MGCGNSSQRITPSIVEAAPMAPVVYANVGVQTVPYVKSRKTVVKEPNQPPKIVIFKAPELDIHQKYRGTSNKSPETNSAKFAKFPSKGSNKPWMIKLSPAGHIRNRRRSESLNNPLTKPGCPTEILPGAKLAQWRIKRSLSLGIVQRATENEELGKEKQTISIGKGASKTDFLSNISSKKRLLAHQSSSHSSIPEPFDPKSEKGFVKPVLKKSDIFTNKSTTKNASSMQVITKEDPKSVHKGSLNSLSNSGANKYFPLVVKKKGKKRKRITEIAEETENLENSRVIEMALNEKVEPEDQTREALKDPEAPAQKEGEEQPQVDLMKLLSEQLFGKQPMNPKLDESSNSESKDVVEMGPKEEPAKLPSQEDTPLKRGSRKMSRNSSRESSKKNVRLHPRGMTKLIQDKKMEKVEINVNGQYQCHTFAKVKRPL